MAASSSSLVAQLRRRIQDERVGRTAFRLACTDEAASDCLLDLSRSDVLTTTVMNARDAVDLSIDLTDPLYNTARLLAEHLASLPGYAVSIEQDYEENHPTTDMRLVGSLSIIGQAVAFRHHIFSDEDLLEVLATACTRHNVNYTPQTVPKNEETWILMLAQAEVNRVLASDAAKRRNLELSVEQLLKVASDIEEAYSRDRRRQERAIPVPKFSGQATGQGDVIIGMSYRRSLRSGFYAPMAGALNASVPVLEEPDPARDVEDTKVTLHWQRNVDQNFYAYELWRDTVPIIERPRGLRVQGENSELLRESMKLPYTSKLAFRSFGAHSNKDNIGWATFIEQAGQIITEFTDSVDDTIGAGSNTSATPLEPDTIYFYRLFVITLNYEYEGSNVVSARTKSLRALMTSVGASPLSPVEGVATTVITMTGERFAADTKVFVGDKAAVPTLVSPTVITFPVPTFNNPAATNKSYDVVVESGNGLRDVLSNGLKYLGV